MKEVIAVETLSIDGDSGNATIVDQAGDVRSGYDVTRYGLPMTNTHRIALMGPRRDIAAEEANPQQLVVATDPVEPIAKPEVEVKVVGHFMDLGVRATRLIRMMDNFAHASMLTGLIASQDPDRQERIEKYGGAKGKIGEANIKRCIAEINRREVDNMWNGTDYGQIYGPPRANDGILNHEYVGFNHQARASFVGPSRQSNRDEFRKKLAVYKK